MEKGTGKQLETHVWDPDEPEEFVMLEDDEKVMRKEERERWAEWDKASGSRCSEGSVDTATSRQPSDGGSISSTGAWTTSKI
jgi:hypothetical protein